MGRARREMKRERKEEEVRGQQVDSGGCEEREGREENLESKYI